MEQIRGIAYARSSLLGNPSDQYGGKGIAMIIRNFKAVVTIKSARQFELIGKSPYKLSYSSLKEAVPPLIKIEHHSDGGICLLQAAIKQFVHYWPVFFTLSSGDERLKFQMSYHSTIPYQVGLSGSSAIIIAALRTLMKLFDVNIEPARLAELALAAEVEDLGIRAGPLDRVVQSYENVLHMDFRPPRTAASYKLLDPSLLPPLFIAWDPQQGENSGKIHNDVWIRWQRGDADVRQAIAMLPTLVDQGMMCLKKNNISGLQKLVNKNFDIRASIYNLAPRNFEMIDIGRALGAGTNFCGSGGSIIGVMQNDSLYPLIERAYTSKGYQFARPLIK